MNDSALTVPSPSSGRQLTTVLGWFDWLRLVGNDWLRWATIDALRLLGCDSLRVRLGTWFGLDGWAPEWTPQGAAAAREPRQDKFPLMTELNRTLGSFFDRIEASQKERLEARLGPKAAAKATAALEQRLGPKRSADGRWL